jgi:hypothetical protein
LILRHPKHQNRGSTARPHRESEQILQKQEILGHFHLTSEKDIDAPKAGQPGITVARNGHRCELDVELAAVGDGNVSDNDTHGVICETGNSKDDFRPGKLRNATSDVREMAIDLLEN